MTRCPTDPATALHRLATELGGTLEPDGDCFRYTGRGGLQTSGTEPQLLGFLAYAAWWRDDREEVRARVGFDGPVTEVADGPTADALRWLAGQGPAVERLAKAKRFAAPP